MKIQIIAKAPGQGRDTYTVEVDEEARTELTDQQIVNCADALPLSSADRLTYRDKQHNFGGLVQRQGRTNVYKVVVYTD